MKTRILFKTIGLLVLTGMSYGTTVVPLSVEDLTQISSHVLEGRAVSSWTQWNPAHTVILTYTRFEISRKLKGEVGSTVVVRELGGTLDGITEKVAGVRYWKTEDQALLFLRPGEIQDGSLVITGLIQGNFLMYRAASGEMLASNGAPEASAYKLGSTEVRGYKGSAMKLTEIEARIQKAVRQ